MIKPVLTASILAVSLISAVAHAHKANDIIIRAGGIFVDPKNESDFVDVGGNQSSLKAEADTNIQLGLNFQYMFTDNIGIEVLAATPFSHKLTLGSNVPSPLDGLSLGKVKHLPPTISAIWYPLDSDYQFQPYLGFGVNYTNFFNEKLTGEAKTAGFNGLSLKRSWGWAAQVGADYMLNDNWLINGQVRYINIETTAKTHLGPTEVTAKYKLNPWVYMIGIGYRF